MSVEQCVRCSQDAATALGIYLTGEDGPVLGGRGFHCGRCAAEAVAEYSGRAFRYLEIQPIGMTNAAGRSCLFHFQYITTGPEPCLKASELDRDAQLGYEATVLAEPGESDISLIGRLLVKLRRMLARIDVEQAPELTLGLSMTSSEIRGVLSYDSECDGPCVIVDGRALDWETFGQLLLSHEGFQFRLSLVDPTDEI